MTYAFTFDTSTCTGCKACQIACKDKNSLPTGVLWRRVYEVSGGSWQRKGNAWTTDVFAYNLSIACNHCVHPKCAGVCPTNAYVVRDDGIVYIDETRCMGCGYCAWACPYSAPQYNPAPGNMTKCNFCFDHLDAGQPPACVAACPMRALEFVEVDSGQWTGDSQMPLWLLPAHEHPFPLPAFSHTEPRIAIAPHSAMQRGGEAKIANWEEVRLRGVRLFDEVPLVAFTLLGQMAGGMAVTLARVGGTLHNIGPLWAILALIFAAILIAFLHLGKPANARHALDHLRKSWLSREILTLGLFGFSGAGMLLLIWLDGSTEIVWLMAAMGLIFLFSMSQVYRLRTVPIWDSGRTLAAFLMSAGVLGVQGVNLFTPLEWMGWALILLFVGEAVLALTERHTGHIAANQIRVGLLLAGMAGGAVVAITPKQPWILIIPLFVVSILQEMIGRWRFYAKRNNSL